LNKPNKKRTADRFTAVRFYVRKIICLNGNSATAARLAVAAAFFYGLSRSGKHFPAITSFGFFAANGA